MAIVEWQPRPTRFAAARASPQEFLLGLFDQFVFKLSKGGSFLRWRPVGRRSSRGLQPGSGLPRGKCPSLRRTFTAPHLRFATYLSASMKFASLNSDRGRRGLNLRRVAGGKSPASWRLDARYRRRSGDQSSLSKFCSLSLG